jgi:toxin ParE1/3/4
MARYALLRRARADLRGIRDHILQAHPARAVSFVDELLERCQLLADNPLIGRARPELRQGVRSFPHGDYLIFYRPAAGGVTIVRVLHGARDARRLL